MTEALLIVLAIGIIFLIVKKDDKDKDMAETKVTIRQVEGLETELDGKQATLVSGDNLKTLNSESLLGGGNITLSGVGETNTASNLGAGAGVFAQKNGVDLEFKGLVAGSGITLTPSSTGITIASTASGSGEVNTGANLGTANGIYAFKSGDVLSFKSLRAGTNVTMSATSTEITINATGIGETNTASNLGAGLGIYSSKVGVDIRLKSLIAGAGVTMSATADAITINAAGATNYWTDSTTYIYPNTQGSGVDVRMWDIGGAYVKVPEQSGVLPQNYSQQTDFNPYVQWVGQNNQYLMKTKRTAANFTRAVSGYETLTYLSSHVVVHDSAAGYQHPTDPFAGRTMTNAYEARVMHRGPADCNGFFGLVSTFADSRSDGHVYWQGHPTGVVIAGSVYANTPKTNLNGFEFQLYDGGQESPFNAGQSNTTAIGGVIGLYRHNSVSQQGQYWAGLRCQAAGAVYSDSAFQAFFKFDIGFDAVHMINREGGPNAAFAMRAGQRMYLGCPTSQPEDKTTVGGPYLVSNGTDITVGGGIIRQTAGLGIVTPTKATTVVAGTASAMPSQPFTYVLIQLDGVDYYLPVFQKA